MANQIIGIDWGNMPDYTTVTSTCSACKATLEHKQIISSRIKTEITAYKVCPRCGVMFFKSIVI